MVTTAVTEYPMLNYNRCQRDFISKSFLSKRH